MKNLKRSILFFGAAVIIALIISSTTALGLGNRIYVHTSADATHGIVFPVGRLISCQDLNTGVTKLSFTGFFGNGVFRFLKAHHDYKITDVPAQIYEIVYDLVGSEDVTLIEHGR